jgi:hypothetical protein
MNMPRVIMIGLALLLASTKGALCQNTDRKSFADDVRQTLEGDVKKEFEELKKRLLAIVELRMHASRIFGEADFPRAPIN